MKATSEKRVLIGAQAAAENSRAPAEFTRERRSSASELALRRERWWPALPLAGRYVSRLPVLGAASGASRAPTRPSWTRWTRCSIRSTSLPAVLDRSIRKNTRGWPLPPRVRLALSIGAEANRLQMRLEGSLAAMGDPRSWELYYPADRPAARTAYGRGAL
jgi:hypothetical protein